VPLNCHLNGASRSRYDDANAFIGVKPHGSTLALHYNDGCQVTYRVVGGFVLRVSYRASADSNTMYCIIGGVAGGAVVLALVVLVAVLARKRQANGYQSVDVWVCLKLYH
jgi:hypothetical protein